jgi:hypothetical protein
MNRIAWSLLFAAPLGLTLGCGVDASLVGGACAAGYTECNNVCIPTTKDPKNCGGCGTVCASGVCENSECVSVVDARADVASRHDAETDGHARDAAHDAGLDTRAQDGATEATAKDGASDVSHDDAQQDAQHTDAAPTDGALHDGHTTDGATSDAHSVDQCAPPYTTTASCGACGASCGMAQVCAPPLDAGVDAAADAGPYSCVAACPLPYLACGGTCIDVSSDPENCGRCGNACLSGICVKGLCTGSASGDIVIIGHDYAAPSVHVSEGMLLANAVFLPAANPVRVLSYEQYSNATQVANVKSVLTHAAMALGRTVVLTTVNNSTLVPTDLGSSSYDVLLVYDQAAAPAGALAPIGTAWQSSLNLFLLAGGDVVILDGASGANPQMAGFMTAANLLQATGETPIASGTQLLVVASGDAVGNSVVSPYAAQMDTVSITTSEANGGNVTYVVDDLLGGNLVPVVIHKTITPP